MKFILKSDTTYSEDIFRTGHFVVLLGTINHAKKKSGWTFAKNKTEMMVMNEAFLNDDKATKSHLPCCYT